MKQTCIGIGTKKEEEEEEKKNKNNKKTTTKNKKKTTTKKQQQKNNTLTKFFRLCSNIYQLLLSLDSFIIFRKPEV